MANAQMNAICEKFMEEYLELSDARKSTFSRLCNKLLNENFIYYSNVDQKDKNDYYEILSLKSIIENYFAMLDFDLINVDTYKIFYLKTTENRNRIRLKKLDTVMLLIFRLLYHKGSQNVNLSADISATLGELIQEINKTGIFKERLTKTDLLNSLKTLRRYKLIYFDFNDWNDDDIIFIYPTILYIVKIDDINLLNEKIKEYRNNDNTEENEDEISEDEID